jgi:hypothetical protein
MMKLPTRFSSATNFILLVIGTQLSYIFSPNLRLSLLVLLISGLLMRVWLTLPILKIVATLLLVTLPIEMGIRGWMIPAALPQLPSDSPGYFYYFGISTMHLLLAGVSILAYPLLKNSKMTTEVFWLAGWLLLSMVSAFFAPHLQLAITGIYINVIFFLLYMTSHSGIINKQTLITLIIVCFGIFGVVSSIQSIRKGPVGLNFEPASYTRSFYTTDGDRQYRASGFSGHPTFFASLMSIFFPVVLYELVQRKSIFPNTMTAVAFILGTIGIFTTVSRSAFAAIGLSTIAILFIQKPKISGKLAIILLMPVIVSLPMILMRLESLTEYFGPEGNSVGRAKLANQAFMQMSKYPLFGSGPNHFVARMTEQSNLDPMLQNFLYPVHNIWLLFGAELGIPALACFVLFVFYVLKRNIPKKNHPLLGMWLGVLTFLVNSQYHTLFHQDASFGYFIFILGILSTGRLNEKQA